MRWHDIGAVVVLSVACASPCVAQDSNILAPIDQIERLLREGEFRVIGMVPSRGLPSERTYQATVQADDQVLQMKYAPAVRGADRFNNRPRYEVAAYEVQKLFLDPDEFVVPPTVLRCFPLDEVQATLNLVPGDYKPEAEATFDEWRMTMVALQYWLWNVDVPDELEDDDMLENPAYERNLANFNLLTYLIRHNDSNEGNFLRSLDPENPRVFSVDNGVAFSNEESDRGYRWRELRLDRYPAKAIERLRGYTLEDLYERLGTVAEFEVRGGGFVQIPPTENLDPGDGVRRDETRIQLGLTDSEIRNLHRRLTRLLEWIDDGRYELIP